MSVDWVNQEKTKRFKTKNALDQTKTDVGMAFLLSRSATQ